MLEALFTTDQPFGPTVAPPNEDPAIFPKVFSRANKPYEVALRRRNPIFGRRGSGKTSLLKSFKLNGEYQIIVDLKPDEAFQSIVLNIDDLSTGVVFVESIARFWDCLLWTTIMHKLTVSCANDSCPDTIRRFLTGAGVRNEMGPYDVIRTILEAARTRMPPGATSVLAQIASSLTFENITFDTARNDALRYMQNHCVKAVVLLDTLENFKLEIQRMGYAVAGLLKCQELFSSPGHPVDLKFCLPSELYHVLQELSENPLKDFEHRILLHWHAGELITLACERFLIFLQTYHPDLHQSLSYLDLRSRAEAQTFWDHVFPPTITNRLGVVENTQAYILRHTQLIPRHFLRILNSIATANLRINNAPTSFCEAAIVDGVANVEEELCLDVCTGFRYTQPSLPEILRTCIKHLPLSFARGTLHRVYNRHGKGIGAIDDFFTFEKGLLEAGLIGRVTPEHSDRYIEALFEYTVPHRLHTSDEDRLCLHPLVSEAFAAEKRHEDLGGIKVIYPYGTRVDTQDLRGDLR